MYGIVKCFLLLGAAVAASSFSLGPNDVIFHLFTRQNPEQSQPLLPSMNSILGSTMFSLGRPTVISIHTSGEAATGNFNAFFVPSHLSVWDVNLIAVDWSLGAGMYTQGLSQAPQCGRIIAQFLNILINDFGYNANNVLIVGHGLGGHIAGIAARNINGVVPHIIALDPSLHGWTHHPERLSTDAATVVEVLHTTAGIVGYDQPLGHVNFFANGGSLQPGCATDSSCSHTYAYAFYAESLTAEINNGNRFIGTRCDSYEQAIVMGCTGARDSTFGGTATKTTANSGIFTFQTNPAQPFATN